MIEWIVGALGSLDILVGALTASITLISALIWALMKLVRGLKALKKEFKAPARPIRSRR